MDPAVLRNRLVVATGLWRETTDEPLPRMPPGDPLEQLQGFELKVVELVFAHASAETARQVAEKTWDVVHDRPDDDPVKQRVVKGHEELARLAAEGGS
ncbi:MAG TPA: hypothetical protein VGV10_05195 [Thermoleophilaceae bacterium]|nr:hypothetical protein [Thermoleophilaceae bacterium]